MVFGDYNIDLTNEHSKELILLKKSCREIGLTIESPNETTRENAVLDFLIRGAHVKVGKNQVIPSLSDHKAIVWELELALPSKLKPRKLPSRKKAESITLKLLRNPEVTHSAIFLHELYLYRQDTKGGIWALCKAKRRETQLLDKLLQLEEKEDIIKCIEDFNTQRWKHVERLRWSNSSKEAYDTLRRILKYRETGGLITKVLKDDGTYHRRSIRN